MRDLNSDKLKLTLRTTERSVDVLRKEVYPPETYPGLSSKQDRIRQAMQDVTLMNSRGGRPADICHGLCSAAESEGGLLPLLVATDGSALIQPGDDGGVRIGVEQVGGDGGEEDEHMSFVDLDDEELREQTKSLDAADLAEWMQRLVEIQESIEMEDVIAASAAGDG